MFKIIWMDLDGEDKVIHGFKRREDAQEYINTHNFLDDEYPIVIPE